MLKVGMGAIGLTLRLEWNWPFSMILALASAEAIRLFERSFRFVRLATSMLILVTLNSSWGLSFAVPWMSLGACGWESMLIWRTCREPLLAVRRSILNGLVSASV